MSPFSASENCKRGVCLGVVLSLFGCATQPDPNLYSRMDATNFAAANAGFVSKNNASDIADLRNQVAQMSDRLASMNDSVGGMKSKLDQIYICKQQVNNAISGVPCNY